MKYKSFWFEIISNFNLTEGLKTCNHADETPSLFTFKTFLAIDFNPIFKIINEKCFFCSLLPRWVITTIWLSEQLLLIHFFVILLTCCGGILWIGVNIESLCVYTCVCVYFCLLSETVNQTLLFFVSLLLCHLFLHVHGK